MDEYEKTYNVTVDLIREGFFPSNDMIMDRLGIFSVNTSSGGWARLNGTKAKARAAALADNGYFKQNGRWTR